MVLTMDNHDNHISIKTIEAAMANDIILVGFPGRTTHLLQPLDVKVKCVFVNTLSQSKPFETTS